MASRSPAWARSCLSRRSALTAKARPTCGGTRALTSSRPRCMATEAAAPIMQLHFADVQPPRERTELDTVLRAIQKKDAARIYRAFLQWTDVMADEASPLHAGAVQEVLELPGPTFSEIVRSLDPFTASDDAASGLKISAGESHYTAAGKLVDSYGVRDRHRRVLAGLQTLFRIRTSSQPPTVADYETAVRAAGAAVDFHAAREFWNSTAGNGQQEWRTMRTWNEFLKAFFMTEPLYYQFDRARIAVKARDLPRSNYPISHKKLIKLDQQRFSINALQQGPWNRSLMDMEEEVTRELRKRVQSRGYRDHWIRGLSYGRDMDEALLCTSIKAFSRSSSLYAIKELVFKAYYGITIENDNERDPTHISITGGHEFTVDSPLRPTTALLEAIVDAYGSMSHIALAMQLIHFISHRYQIPIPHTVWSSLLNWTYLFSSKPFAPARKVLGNWESTTQRPVDVMQVWQAMTSPSHGNTIPTFDDYDIYIKTLIVQRCVVKAFAAINEYALPYYATLVDAYETAFADEILQAEAAGGHAPRRATLRRQKAETIKDHTHNRITLWFKNLLRVISANRHFRDGPVGREMVPHIIRDYGYFLPATVKYRTAQGTVTFELAGDESATTERVQWARRWRTTLPANRSGKHVRGIPGSDAVEFPWPMVPQMRVLETRPVAKQRMERMAAPPAARGGRWWAELEQQLML